MRASAGAGGGLDGSKFSTDFFSPSGTSSKSLLRSATASSSSLTKASRDRSPRKFSTARSSTPTSFRQLEEPLEVSDRQQQLADQGQPRQVPAQVLDGSKFNTDFFSPARRAS
ncbi:hypothetical protein DIPPA_20451 [Diplonema papillatum]|nr:hypothetical protein DIPPA_20451 [Diplonema papillatum]